MPPPPAGDEKVEYNFVHANSRLGTSVGLVGLAPSLSARNQNLFRLRHAPRLDVIADVQQPRRYLPWRGVMVYFVAAVALRVWLRVVATGVLRGCCSAAAAAGASRQTVTRTPRRVELAGYAPPCR